jgi:lipid II:glycine glycyltransferase (peptidoglycan interpeptide bridge formation enzyme)
MIMTREITHPLQSQAWGEFRKEWGNKVVNFDFGQIIFSKVPYSNFTIGTFIKGSKPNKQQLDELKKIAKENKAIFVKIESNYVAKDKSEIIKLTNLLHKSGCVRGKTLFTPTSFWLDLTKSEEELLKSFSSKTRYNIRLAQKHGVTVIEDNSDKAFEKYLELTRKTVQRQKFYAHSEKYHRLMWQHLHKNLTAIGQHPIARLLTAKYKNEIITTWIVFVWHDFLYYPYGASSDKYKNVMSNNLMMWEAIKLGKRLDLKTFDLWGREEGKGFTKFKEGYNPRVVEFLGSWDLIINPLLYWPYRTAESIRWFLLKIPAKMGVIKPKF